MNKKVVLGLLAACIAVSEVLTPLAVSWWLDQALNKVMPARQHNVSARSLPGLSLWFGSFDNV